MAVAIRVTCKTVQDSNRENMVKKKSQKTIAIYQRNSFIQDVFFYLFLLYISGGTLLIFSFLKFIYSFACLCQPAAW